MERLDYLAIGHVTRDILPAGGTVFGGTVTYSALAATALGCRTGVITSADPGVDLRAAFPAFGGHAIQVHCVPAEQTTTFENVYQSDGRKQHIYHVAAQLGAGDLLPGWDRARIVHLGPVAQEVDPEIIVQFSNSLVGLTPQGWMRRWDGSGRVIPAAWDLAPQVFPLTAAVIISEEDLPDNAALTQYRQWAPLLVLTAGGNGCTVFMGAEMRHFPATNVTAIELTGAGDIFATAFLVRLHQTGGSPWEAARFANEIAGLSVTQPALKDKIQHIRQLVDNNKQ